MKGKKGAVGREDEILMAVLGPEDGRREAWNVHFCGLRVPVTKEEPEMTILPNSQIFPCYFVNFRVSHGLFAHMKRVFARAENAKELYAMLDSGYFPIVAEGVTIVRAPWALWTD